MANEDKIIKPTSSTSLKNQILNAETEPGGLTEGKLINIINKTLPIDRKLIVQEVGAPGTSTRTIDAPLSKIYTNFDYNKDIVITEQITSEGIFPSSVGIIQNNSFYTSSNQNASSSAYYYTVTDGDTTSSNNLFDIAYCSISSSNSSSQMMYKQFANLLLANNDDYFTFNSGVDAHSIIALSFKRSRYKEKVDPGNWMLKVYSGSTTMSLVDDSSDNPSTKTVVGERLSIVSGTIGSVSSSHSWGFAYPDMGLFIIDADQFATSCSYSSSLDFISNLDYLQARNEQRLKDINYFARVMNKEYNYSNNPTFFTSSNGEFTFDTFNKDPKVYITTIGLYNDRNQLLASARLSKPVEKSFEKEAIFRIRLSF